METKFNWKNKEKLTHKDALEPAMQINTQEEADKYLKDYTEYIQKDLDVNPNKEGLTAEQIAKSNLGYWAGYCSNEVRSKVEKLFKCEHPVFGSIEKNGIPTAKEAFNKGLELGEKFKKQENGKEI